MQDCLDNDSVPLLLPAEPVSASARFCSSTRSVSGTYVSIERHTEIGGGGASAG